MKFKISSILAGMYLVLGVFSFLWLEMFLLDTFVDDWTMTGNLMIAIAALSLIVCAFLVLAYPMYLLKQKQKNDAVVVFASTAISICIAISLLYLM